MRATLRDAIRFLLCDVANFRWTRYMCKCDDPVPVAYYCHAGNCTIYRCSRCGRYLNVIPSRCAVETASMFHDVIERMHKQEER